MDSYKRNQFVDSRVKKGTKVASKSHISSRAFQSLEAIGIPLDQSIDAKDDKINKLAPKNSRLE